MKGLSFFLLIFLIFTGILISCSEDDNVVVDPKPLQLETPFYFGDALIPEDNQLTEQGVELGRFLFYDVRLSADNSMSCGSCHIQNKAFTSGLQFDQGVRGQEVSKNTMSLANLLWSNRFFWNGRQATLEGVSSEVIEHPLEFDQSVEQAIQKLEESGEYGPRFEAAFGDAEINEDRIGKAIAQFTRTMISSNSRYDQWLRDEIELTESELRGEKLFFTHPDASVSVRGGNCGDCHSNFLTSGFNTEFDGFHNNGLDTDDELEDGLFKVTGNPADRGKFKAPTLRNVELTSPYMHDGRFQTLEEVLEHYNEHIRMSETLDPLIIEASNDEIVPGTEIKLGLTEQEKQDIIAFLKTLTDESFTADEKFSDPFN